MDERIWHVTQALRGRKWEVRDPTGKVVAHCDEGWVAMHLAAGISLTTFDQRVDHVHEQRYGSLGMKAARAIKEE
ncbi:hypothetical protein ACVWXL_005469 [Bradyrhizobium sp. GM22.5]